MGVSWRWDWGRSRLGQRGEDNPSFNNKINDLSRISEDLDSRGIIDPFQTGVVGRDDPVVDQKFALSRSGLEDIADGDAGVAIGKMRVIPTSRNGDSKSIAWNSG